MRSTSHAFRATLALSRHATHRPRGRHNTQGSHDLSYTRDPGPGRAPPPHSDHPRARRDSPLSPHSIFARPATRLARALRVRLHRNSHLRSVHRLWSLLVLRVSLTTDRVVGTAACHTVSSGRARLQARRVPPARKRHPQQRHQLKRPCSTVEWKEAPEEEAAAGMARRAV